MSVTTRRERAPGRFWATITTLAALAGLIGLASYGSVGRDGDLTAFNARRPDVARLNPKLRDALRNATTDAAADGVEILINSGWRSRQHQAQLFDDAVVKHGSAKAAARWVATAEASAHVSGQAVDVGPSQAAAWLSRHGAKYGLCQIYRNERWHYELRPAAISGRCPGMYASPADDPRLKRVARASARVRN